jgi:hypothetical protein
MGYLVVLRLKKAKDGSGGAWVMSMGYVLYLGLKSSVVHVY